MPSADSTPQLQSLLDAAASKTCTIPTGGYRLSSTGLGYGNGARIVVAGDLYNDHGPAVGTQYCLTNRTGGRLRDVTVTGQGGSFQGAATSANGATRKGLGIVAVDGFTITNIVTGGPLTGFAVEVKNATGGHLSGLTIASTLNLAGADGLHFFGACQGIAGSNITVSSGDDAVSFTCENAESLNATMNQITLSTLTLDTAAYSCIKVYTGPGTGKATIRNISLSGIKGRVTQGPTGCPLMIENMGAAQGCVVDGITIASADLDFGAATQSGPCAYMVDATNVTLRNVTLRGRRDGQFLRAVRCKGLTVTGEVWDTIPGNSMTDLVQLEGCGNYSINLVVRSATGARLGSLVVANKGVDAGTRYLGMTGT